MRPLELPDTGLSDGQKVETTRFLALFSPHRGTLAIVLALIALGALTGVISPFLVREIVDVALPEGDVALLAWCAFGMIAVYVAGAIFTVLQSFLSTRVGQAIMHDLRVRVFAHLQRMGLPFFTSTRTGEIQSRIFNDIGAMQLVVTNVATQIVSASATILMSAIAMIAMDWRLFLFSLVTTPIASVLNRRVGKRRRALVKRRQEAAADLSAHIQESLSVSGILLSTTLGRSEPIIEAFENESRDLSRLEVESEMAGRWMQGLYSVLLWIIPALTYLIGGVLFIRGLGDLTIGTLVAFVAMQTTLFPQLNTLLRVATQVRASLALFTRVFEYLDLEVPIKEAEEAQTFPGGRARGHVSFEDVHFAYPGAERDTIAGVTFEVPRGTHTAIVGSTGSGKTTLGYLLSRLYDVSSGRVLIDGIDVRELTLDSLAGAVGVVTQETYLLHASIADNLRFVKPDASEADMVRACEMAQIHAHIEALPHGYNTIVGERGYRFSGGEKQRLAIARTILRDPPILFLDEATSALDTVTERAMGGALRSLSEGRATISIAHRLSTVRDADQILVVKAGRICERGTFDDLRAAGGEFSRLATGGRQA
ncbi:hypothetical protein DAD186_17100 [Dermabacter vaginalis]|uniref:ABC transporter ATP-binding protein n=1 Tax=Dermabacter vaginalis TaxID=1630135 RepID=A0A1B0ZK05_9MICO|nr:ABC transporter ATP-binding protein [Dermabacter vaginalis]ANP28260.1 hypothetical protein DAD186_17100 [Dermabacter vaginalis]